MCNMGTGLVHSMTNVPALWYVFKCKLAGMYGNTVVFVHRHSSYVC